MAKDQKMSDQNDVKSLKSEEFKGFLSSCISNFVNDLKEKGYDIELDKISFKRSEFSNCKCGETFYIDENNVKQVRCKKC